MYYKTLVKKETKEYYTVLDYELYAVTIPSLFPMGYSMQDIRDRLCEESNAILHEFELLSIYVSLVNSDDIEPKYIGLDWPDYQIYMEHNDWKQVVMTEHNGRSYAIIPVHIILEIDEKNS